MPASARQRRHAARSPNAGGTGTIGHSFPVRRLSISFGPSPRGHLHTLNRSKPTIRAGRRSGRRWGPTGRSETPRVSPDRRQPTGINQKESYSALHNTRDPLPLQAYIKGICPLRFFRILPCAIPEFFVVESPTISPRGHTLACQPYPLCGEGQSVSVRARPCWPALPCTTISRFLAFSRRFLLSECRKQSKSSVP